jgi:VCBS repeat-containing protein
VVLLALAVPALALAAFKESKGSDGGPSCLGLEVTVPGTGGEDRLRGTPEDDVIAGLGGDDRVIGGGGLDVICGGPGDDFVTTGKGPDKIAGGVGDDRLVSRLGPDMVYGMQGEDLLDGGPGRDRCLGGGGEDVERACETEAPPVSKGGCRGKGADKGKCRNSSPGATGDSASTDEETAKAIDVLANDADADGDSLTVVSVDATGTRGAVAIAGGGVSFDPRGRFDQLAAGQSANDSFAYTISDGNGHTATATVAVAVSGVDDPPKAVGDNAAAKENDSSVHVDVFANDTDVDGGPKAVQSATDGAHGTVTVSGGGNGADYHPVASYCGPDTFTYALNGGSTATVSVEIECIDDAPAAVDDSATVQEDDPGAAIGVLANDTDTDGGPKEVKSVTQPANGTVTITGGGTGLTYAPDADYCNEPPGTTLDSFDYTLNSGSAPSGSTATVAVKVTCVDDEPAAAGDAKTVAEDSSATAIDVLANDTDTDGGTKKVESVTQPANGTVVITGGGTGLTYAPDADYCNDPPGTALDSFDYTLNGGSKGTVSVKVSCVDDAPKVVDDAKTVAEDSSATAIDVLANDTDVDGGTKTIESVTQPANGTVVITGGGAGLTYEPDASYCNEPPGTTPDTFTYTLNGGSTATVSVKVSCADDAPTAVDDSTSVEEDAGATAIDVLANDTDTDGGPKKVESVTQPANGTVVITGGGTGLTYAPDADYCDEAEDDTFTYALNGGSDATVSVEVECVEDVPGAVNDSATVEEDSSATAIDVLANDTDPDGGSKTIESVTQPANGTVAITGGGTGLTYEPDADYCNEPPGTTPDTFTYTLNGGSTATVSVKVECVDDLPIAVNDTDSLEEDAGATAVDVLANDTDVDGGTKTIESVTQPANGTVVITGGGTGLTYEPDADYCDEAEDDTFTYALNGGSEATVSVEVECVDDAPTAVGNSAGVKEDSGANAIDVLANDTDVDGGPKTIESVTQPANGAVEITGGGTGLTYAPDADYCDEAEDDTFTYTLNGGSEATVSVEVECVDDAPTAVNDSSTVEEDSGETTIDVLANDTDPDGGAKTIESVEQPANGAVEITNSGTDLTYEPDADYCNEPPGATPDTFTYEITGGAEATVAVKVECVNDPPTDLSLSSSSLKENEPAGTEVGSFSTTDVDPGDTFTYSLVSGTGSTDNGSFEISGSKLKAKESFNFEVKSSYSIRVRSTDGGGESVEKELTITVQNANDPPTALALSNAELNENEPAGTEIGALSSTDEDVGDTFTYSLVSGGGSTDNGSFEISGNKLKAKESFNFEAKSSYSIRVRTTDSGGKTFEKELTVTVLNVNDAPKAVADFYSGAVGNTTAVLGDVVSEPNVSLSGMSGNVPSANDSDEDAGDTISVVAETVSTTGGGTATIDADGTFTYKPGVGDKNQTDSFTYKVTDGEATSSGTVSVGIENTLVWYINGGAASEGDGRSATPYKTLSGINGAAGAGDADGSSDYLFLYGAGTYSGGLPLEASQKLIGSPHGLSVPNHANLVAASGSNPVITNAGGDAIALASSSEVQRVNASNASGVGIRGTSITTATVGANTTVSNNSGGGVVLSGAAGGEISIGSTIENQNGSVVSVANRNSGTVTFSGAITSANGGVSASTNTGANIVFTGALNLTRSNGEAFSVTGGGSIKATASGSKASTTNATAVRVTGTTIASGGVNFQSVSSSAASNGVVLENTGSTAGLTVSGTGSAGSGGTITTSTGPGILLSSTSGVSLTNVKVTNGGDDGIRGSSVSGFSLSSSEVSGNGNAVTENGLDFINLTGTVGLSKATVTGSADRNVAVVNETGTLTATVTEGTYSNTNNSANGSDAIFFEGTGSGTINATIEKATFTNNRDDHVQVTTDAANTTTENVTIKENTMSNTVGQPGGAVTLNPGGNATMEASVLGNTITGARIEGITVDTPGSQFSPQPAQVDVTISNNTIGNPAVSQSGSSSGNAVGVRSNGAATVDALITNNNLYQYVNANGLLLVQNDGSGALNATVRSNVITKPDPLAVRGIRAEIGADVGDKGTSCLDIGGAGALANNLTGSSTGGTTNLRLEMNGEATVNLPGYGGSAHDHTAVQNYLASRNTAPDGVSASQFDATSNYGTTSSCQLP